MAIVLSERFAQQENVLTKMDPRLKLAFCLSCLGLVVWTTRPLVVLLLGGMLLAAMLAVRISLKYVLLRMLPGIGMAAMIAVTQLFWKGTLPGLNGLWVPGRLLFTGKVWSTGYCWAPGYWPVCL